MKAFVLCMALAAIPAYSQAVSFDCNKASNYVENTLCTDQHLGEMDSQLSAIYSDYLRAGANLNIPSTSLKEIKDEQRAWLARRNKCRNKECITELYTRRINELCLSQAVGYHLPACLNNASHDAVKKVIYFAAENPPTANVPAEAPLCYKFAVNSIEEQLQKLLNKYPNLYDYRISRTSNNAEILVAKRTDETGKIIDYYYSTDPDLCMDQVKRKSNLSVQNQPPAYIPPVHGTADQVAIAQQEVAGPDSAYPYNGYAASGKTSASTRASDEINHVNYQESNSGDIQFYAAAIDSQIRQVWVRPLGTRQDLSASVEIQLHPGGEVYPESVKVIRSSGDPDFDRAIVAAVYQASPLPVPSGVDFERFRKLRLEFKPTIAAGDLSSQSNDKLAQANSHNVLHPINNTVKSGTPANQEVPFSGANENLNNPPRAAEIFPPPEQFSGNTQLKKDTPTQQYQTERPGTTNTSMPNKVIQPNANQSSPPAPSQSGVQSPSSEVGSRKEYDQNQTKTINYGNKFFSSFLALWTSLPTLAQWILGIALIGGIGYFYYYLVQKINEYAEAKYDFTPITWISASIMLIPYALFFIANSITNPSDGQGNIHTAIGLSILIVLGLGVWIARETSLSISLGSMLLLILGSVVAVILLAIVVFMAFIAVAMNQEAENRKRRVTIKDREGRVIGYHEPG